MKITNSFLLALCFAVLLFSCSKQKTATPSVRSSTMVDSPMTTNVTNQSLLGKYPYTETYTGTLHVAFIYDPYSGLDTSHAFYKFSVTYLSQNVVVVNCSAQERILNGELYWLTDRPDTVTLDANSNANGNLLAYNCFKVGSGTDQELPATYSIQNGGRFLTVSWDNTYFPVPGVCDWGESTGQFSGASR